MNSPQPAHLIIKSGGSAAMAEWAALFAECAPHVVVHDWNHPPSDVALIDFALVWEPETGRLAQFRQLKAVLSSAAGVDHLLADAQLPALPIVRMVTDESQQRMAEFCLMAAMSLLRDMPRAITQHQQRRWVEYNPPHTAPDVTVGIMGMGTLGAATARLLRAVGYQVQGWSQTRKQIDGVRSYCSNAELPDFLRQSQVLICLLPDTPATLGILNRSLFAQLPPGAMLVNAGRGAQLNVADTLAALDSGQLSSVFLDVVEPEPLPADSPLWTHPRIMLTPHTAASASRRAKARQAAFTIAQWQAGEALSNQYEKARGY